MIVALNARSSIRRGGGLVEIVVGVAILSMAFVSILSVYAYFLKVALSNTRSIQASFLIEEGLEAVKLMRDGNWTADISPVSLGTSHYFSWAGNKWSVSDIPAYVGGFFLRTVQFDSVYRDGSGNIVSSGGSLDEGTRKVTVSVSWNYGGTATTKSASFYMSNLYLN